MNCDESFDLICNETIELDVQSLAEIYFKEYLLPREANGFSYLSEQAYITNYMRGILVDWLIEVSEDFRLQRTTLYLAISFIDNYLSKVNNTEIHEFQLLGITALFIAQKIEEVRLRTVQDFIRSTQNSYTKIQLFDMELKLCQTLNWNLLFVTPIMVYDYFFDQLLSLINGSSHTTELLQHSSEWLYIRGCDLLDRVVLDGEHTKFKPSHLAASVYYVLYEDFGLSEEQLEEITDYPVRILNDCYCYVYTIYKMSYQQNALLDDDNNCHFEKPLFNQIWNNKSLHNFQDYEKLLLQRRVHTLIPPLVHDPLVEEIPILNLSPEREEISLDGEKMVKPESSHDTSICSMNDSNIDPDVSMCSIIETLSNESDKINSNTTSPLKDGEIEKVQCSKSTTTSPLKRNADSSSCESSEMFCGNGSEINNKRRKTLN